MFSKILIANRGEIAVRIIRACKEMGISTVAVFSEADREALHVSLADESYCIGPAPVGESYLNMAAIISASICSGAQAIHPGYGLLSENARFAALCEECNITFIGPRSETIAKTGDKDEARKTMRAAGVPVIPGCDAVSSVEEAKEQAKQIGFPLLIKARAGRRRPRHPPGQGGERAGGGLPERFPRGALGLWRRRGLYGEVPVPGQTH